MQITATNPGAAAAAGAAPNTTRAGAGLLRTGRIISGFAALFLFFDGAARLAGFGPYVEGTVQFGYPEHLAGPIGLALVAATLLYVVPRTAVLGAIVLTGYLGGAVASQVRVEDPFFAFPFVFAVLVWAGLYLREPRLRALLPLRG